MKPILYPKRKKKVDGEIGDENLNIKKI